MGKDPFGFSTQGANYETFRPGYPQKLVQKCLLNLKGRNRYLDVATGTGKLLFSLASSFRECVGSDISSKMVSTAKEKAKNYRGVEIIAQDCMHRFGEKFDLVTVGQALHWLPMPAFLKHSAGNLLQKNGRLAVISYYVKTVTKMDGSPIGYDSFENLLHPHYDFNRDQLLNEYNSPKYCFKQYFENVQKAELQERHHLVLEDFVRYRKTSSSYNLYVQKFPQRQDPLQELVKGLEKGSRLEMTLKYFGYYCDRPLI